MLVALVLGRPSVAQNHQPSADTPSIRTRHARKIMPSPSVVAEPSKAALPEEHEAASQKADPPEKPLPRFLRPEWVIEYITAIYSLIAGFTLWVIKRQASLLERQILGAEDTAQKQLRAYIYIDSAALKFPELGNPEAQVHFKNCGQTPAHDVRGWIHTWFTTHPLSEELPTPPSDFIMAVEAMAPGRVSVFVSPQKSTIQEHMRQWLGTQPLIRLVTCPA